MAWPSFLLAGWGTTAPMPTYRYTCTVALASINPPSTGIPNATLVALLAAGLPQVLPGSTVTDNGNGTLRFGVLLSAADDHAATTLVMSGFDAAVRAVGGVSDLRPSGH